MHNVLFVDHEKCTGCELCVLQCSFSKTQIFSRARSRIKIIRWEEGGICVASMCAHCEEPPCVPICPVNALSKDEETGRVNLDSDLCVRCGQCVTVCPYGAISIDPVSEEVLRCDLCGGEPICVQICPTGAIQYVKADRVGLSKQRQGMEKIKEVMRFALAKAGGEEK